MQIYAVNYFKLNCHLTKCFQKCIWDITLNKSLRGEIIQDYFPSLIHLRQIHENLISVDVDRVGGFEFDYWSVLFRFFFFFRKKKNQIHSPGNSESPSFNAFLSMSFCVTENLSWHLSCPQDIILYLNLWYGYIQNAYYNVRQNKSVCQ